MATLKIEDGKLHVEMHGWDKILTLRSSIVIALEHITAVSLRPEFTDPAKAAHVLRLAGGYWPRAFATGYFAVNGEIVFYDVHEAKNTIELRVEHESVRRLVLEVEEITPEQAVEMIQAALTS